MAKSKKPGGRKQAVSVADIRLTAQLLQSQAARLSGFADLGETMGLAAFEIDGAGLLDRGIDAIDRYLDNIHLAVIRSQREQERSEY